jgi:hypothetical protein
MCYIYYELTLYTAYEYTESADLESDKEADNTGEVQEGLSDADDADASDEESVGEYMDDEEGGETTGSWDDDDEPSW